MIAQTITAADARDRHVRSGKASAQRARIVEFIRKNGGAWCIGELAQSLKIKDNVVSARVNELLYETKELIAYPNRKSRVSNINVRPVGLPPVGQMGLF